MAAPDFAKMECSALLLEAPPAIIVLSSYTLHTATGTPRPCRSHALYLRAVSIYSAKP